MFCCTLLYVHSSFAIILMGKIEPVALLSLSSWCLVMVVWLFLAVPLACLWFVIVVFPDHTHLKILTAKILKQGYRHHTIIRKAFSKFYHRHSELIVKKTFLQQSISELVCYCIVFFFFFFFLFYSRTKYTNKMC